MKNTDKKLKRMPHNKGIESLKKLKKVELFKAGLSIVCKKHGEHVKWRMHTGNNVQCLLCASEWQMNQRRRNPLRFIYRDAKRHAIYHKREFDIDLSDLECLMSLQDGKCKLTGVAFNNETPPSLDRIDSDKGYIKGNIQLIQIKVNVMKSNLSENEFISLCEKIVKHKEQKNEERVNEAQRNQNGKTQEARKAS